MVDDKKTDGVVDNNAITETVQRKKRGLKTASLEANMSARPEEISAAIQHAFQYFNRDIVRTDEECAERINGYFRDCHEQQMMPTVENLSLALGTIRQTLWNWENGMGCSKVRMDMIKKAKQILASIDAEMVSSGKIPQVVYIFRAKNFYGMRDQTDVVVTPNNPLGDSIPAEVIEDKYKLLED